MAISRDSEGRWTYRLRGFTCPDCNLFIEESIYGVPGVSPRWRHLPNTKSQAQQCERDHLAWSIAQHIKSKQPPVLTFEGFWERYLHLCQEKRDNRKSVLIDKQSMWANHIRPFFGQRPLNSITRQDIIAFQELMAEKVHLNKKLRSRTINKNLSFLSSIFTLALIDDRITRASVPLIDNIKLTSEVKKEIRFLTFEELDALLHAARDDQQLYLAILIGADAGLRKGELAGLQMNDCDLRTGKLNVLRNMVRGVYRLPKNGKPRQVPMTRRVREALERYPRIGEAFLFLKQDGSAYTDVDFIRRRFRSACKAAKLEGVGWHTLRHTFCSHLAMKKAQANDIRDVAGHSSITTSQRYMHLSADHRNSVINLLDR